MQLAEEAQQLVNKVKTLFLSTLGEEGLPHASYTPFSRLDSGDFLIFVSELAEHTQNLQQGNASILIIEDESQSEIMFARKRLSFKCTAHCIAKDQSEYEMCLSLFEERHGEIIKTLRQLSDFKLYRLTPLDGRFIKGFGQAYKTNKALTDFVAIRPS